eukprot:gnl/MRDRNA2_/MRDRNA2_28894_c0_seq1.p1 gnl/MRDRNA2_/MRDRNA2_28894_c0~~gnl/MRDRNA2_/MRDRNA2_28894_c0_seq1.p1  ORF type:complete len:542 (+),score=158.31 gnl/MRDRNA2_/MRDRNA2_28894_c0_seq1:88-1713(+)
MSLNDTSADVAQAIAQSKLVADQEWLADYIIGFLKSPSWVTPVMEYIEQHCVIFDTEAENKLEYTVKHNEFRALIDGLLAAHLLEVSIGEEEFQQFIHDGLVNKSLHHILVEQLLSVDDFETFKAMMVQKNKQLQMQAMQQLELQQQQAIEQLATDVTKSIVQVQPELQDQDQTMGEVEEVLSPTSGPAAGWSLYDEEDQVLSEALRLSEETAISKTVQMTDLRKEQEEADMSLAIALSVQVEEERQKRQQCPVEEEAEDPPDSGGASGSVDPTQAHQVAGEPQPASEHPPAVDCEQPPKQEATETTPEPKTVLPIAVETAPAQVQEVVAPVEEKPFSVAEFDALDNSKQKKAPLAMPRMVALAPVKPPARATAKNVTTAALYEDNGRNGPMPVKANVEDLKATPKQPAPTPAPVASRKPVCAAACVPSPQRPTAEEMRQRAEHLKQQRELLVQKKKQEREQKLLEFQRTEGRKGVDGQAHRQVVNAKQTDAQELLSQLTAQPEAAVTSQVSSKDAERAARMRQALTARLKESLYQSLTQV